MPENVPTAHQEIAMRPNVKPGTPTRKEQRKQWGVKPSGKTA